MFNFLLDQHQINTIASLLVEKNPTAFGSDKQRIVNAIHNDIDQVTDLVRSNPDASKADPVVVHFNAYVILAIPSTKAFASGIPLGYSHIISVTVNTVYLTDGEGICDIPAQPDQSARTDNVRYIHLRRFDIIRFGDQVLGSNLSSKGGRTIAFRDNFDGTLSYAVAKCHKNDTYVKKVGNYCARLRLDSDDHCHTINVTINEFRELVDEGKIVAD